MCQHCMTQAATAHQLVVCVGVADVFLFLLSLCMSHAKHWCTQWLVVSHANVTIILSRQPSLGIVILLNRCTRRFPKQLFLDFPCQHASMCETPLRVMPTAACVMSYRFVFLAFPNSLVLECTCSHFFYFPCHFARTDTLCCRSVYTVTQVSLLWADTCNEGTLPSAVLPWQTPPI